MGALIGLCFGIGAWLVVEALDPSERRRPVARRGPSLRGWLNDRGAPHLSLPVFLGGSIASALLAFVLLYAIGRTVIVAAVFALVAAGLPTALLSSHVRRVAAQRREAWPDAIDNLASGIRAGLALPEALAQLAERGPEPLRAHFADFTRRYERQGSFAAALDGLKADLADPVGDRVVEALRLAREVGGGDLGRLLRTLSSHLREDARTRGELASRQQWAVNGARLAVAAPWFVLLMMSFQPEVIGRFAEGAGPYVLLFAGLTSVIAYRLMLRIGRLPTERRVMA